MPENLAQRIHEVPPRLLFPRGAPAPDRLSVVDALPLPATSPPGWLVVAEDNAHRRYGLPIVDDGLRPRRARAGDGWALAVASLSDSRQGPWHIRVLNEPSREALFGAVTEESDASAGGDEVTLVADRYLVRLVSHPNTAPRPTFSPWRHVAGSAPALVSSGALDVTWDGDGIEPPLAAVVTVAERTNGSGLAGLLNREVTFHLRGRDTARETLRLAAGLGNTLASAHLALASPSVELARPTQPLSENDAHALERRVKDLMSEAIVLTNEDVRSTLRGRMRQVRTSLTEVGGAAGIRTLPPVPLDRLDQIVSDGQDFALDPTLLTLAEGPHLAIVDVARLLREVTHVAHGALRRMVSGAEDVPAERVPTWVAAVREQFLSTYSARLQDAGQLSLAPMQLLRAFEIEAECRALIYASRELPTWSSVPDAGLLDLLTPW